METAYESKNKVYYFSLTGSKKSKLEWLKNTDLNSSPIKKIDLKSPYYGFKGGDFSFEEEYNKGIALNKLFIMTSSGIASRNDQACIFDTAQKLDEYLEDLCTLSEEENREKYGIEDTNYWKLSKAMKLVKESNKSDRHKTLIAYRPFRPRWTYIYKINGLTAQVTPKMVKYMQEDNIALVYTRGNVSGGKFNHSFVVKSVIELGFLTVGAPQTTKIAPLYIYNDSLFKTQKNENFRPEIRRMINEKYGAGITAKDILGYVYAILHHKEYKERYQLFIDRDFPKIPFVDSKEAFKKLSGLGKELIDLHLSA